MFNEIWKFGAMFIIIFYLCNLRSHLIKKLRVAPPNSIEDLALPSYKYKVMIPAGVEVVNKASRSLAKQGRFIAQKGENAHL